MNCAGCWTIGVILMTSRLLLVVNCGRLRQRLPAEDLFQSDAEIEAYMKNRGSRSSHLASTSLLKDINRINTRFEKASRFRPAFPKSNLPIETNFSPLHTLPFKDQSVAAGSHQIPLHSQHELPPDLSSQTNAVEDLLPKANLRSLSELISVHVEPPQSDDKDDEESQKVESPEKQAGLEDGDPTSAEKAPPIPMALMQGEVEAREAGQESVASIADVYLLAVVAGCAVAGLSGLLLAGVCWYRLHKKVKAASDVEYPAYGVTGPAKERVGSPGDRKLAQSAQMYHYQHQKQQMIASERPGGDHPGGTGGSDAESEEECEEGDYTVFECPGLATAGEMEVRNPLFNDQTPVATPADK